MYFLLFIVAGHNLLAEVDDSLLELVPLRILTAQAFTLFSLSFFLFALDAFFFLTFQTGFFLSFLFLGLGKDNACGHFAWLASWAQLVHFD